MLSSWFLKFDTLVYSRFWPVGQSTQHFTGRSWCRAKTLTPEGGRENVLHSWKLSGRAQSAGKNKNNTSHWPRQAKAGIYLHTDSQPTRYPAEA